MKNISCCFTGHREIPFGKEAEISEKTGYYIEEAIKKGYEHFYCGGAIGFDTIAAEKVLFLKEKYPHIKLHIVMPCRNQTRGWSQENISRYEAVNKKADEVKCLSEDYYNGCMQMRNRYMVDNSSLLISYLTRLTGGSAYTYNYAQKKGIDTINISE